MSDGSEFYRISWAYGDVTVRAVGGMIAPVYFDLGEGFSISPLHVAPWASGPVDGLSPLLAGLRGEWPCLPFGPARIPANLPRDWSPRQPVDCWDHGYCSNHAWSLVECNSAELTIAIDLPASDPVARLERTIRPEAGAPSIAVELVIYPRRDAIVPFALHPTFVVSEDGVELVGGRYSSVQTYPMQPEPGVSRLKPNQSASSLRALPVEGGVSLDLTRLPLPFKTEELLQLVNCEPPLVLRYPGQHAEVLLDWETEHLPDALLWISNGGRSHAPWSGTHYALGIEPNNSCFDLTRVGTPPAEHPLARRTGLRLLAGVPMRITYRLSARRFVI